MADASNYAVNHAGNILINGTSVDCSNDFDCPFTSICYFLDKANPKLGKCACDYEWGSVGQECKDSSPMSAFRLTWFSIHSIICVFSIFFVLHQIWLLHKSDKGLKRLDVKTTTFIECFFAFLFFLMYSTAGIAIILNPESQPLQSSLSTTKKRSLAHIRNIGLTLFVFFLVAALMNVSILWLEVAIASKRFKRIKSPQLSKHYRYAVAAFDLTAAAVVAAINWYNASLTGIVGVVLFSIVLALYSYSAISIYFVMKKQGTEKGNRVNSSASSNIIKENLLKIRNCAQWVVVFLGTWVIFMLLISRTHPFVRYNVAFTGQIVDIAVYIDLGFLSALISAWGVINYLKKTTGSPSKTIRVEQDMDNADTVDDSAKDKVGVFSGDGTVTREQTAGVDFKESNQY